ncbi:hypothetical protein K435DRAFT_863863 [Dendrothele bispora CBS 962.96]|uniref:NACHT domain-containing protein n=1 Tax=Dendrothele bispora (strain CBS 962.96) TaxID=1314807 RepID=A0A4S8LNL2_DENBC|nr:hypothetical protein K435DRAFT_863863 [Dendrothele bispora CBS 962.96]
MKKEYPLEDSLETVILEWMGIWSKVRLNSAKTPGRNKKTGDPLNLEINKITPDVISSATPAVPIVFKGREELVEQGINILCQQASRFLAILGAGGMGKTSLALHIMNSALVKNKFAGRCYFIPCELFEDAESLVQGLGHVMKLTMQKNKSKHEVLFDHLQAAHDNLLIVFDNFETPWNHDGSRTGVKNLLEKIAQYEKVSLMITMRGPNGPGDIPWEKLGNKSGIPTLSPLSAKEAFKAFVGSNNLQNLDDSENDIDSLLYQLGYVPLAIRLSAQHVKRVPLKALIRMWEKDKTSILMEPTKPGRLTSVSFSIEFSIQIFTIEGRTLELLSAISFLPDGIPFWIEYLDQMFPGEQLSFDVSTLIDSSLIYDHNEGLKMLAPIREHIHSKYPIAQVDIDQLERFYAQFLQNLPNNNMKAQPALQLHINNIEKTYKAQISNGNSKTSFISAVKTLDRFHRYVSVSIGLMYLILQMDENIRKEDEVDLKLRYANNLCWMGRFQDAEAQVVSVKECLNEQGNISQSEADILGRCFETLQDIYYTQRHYEKAINMNLQAQKYFKQSENQWAQANSMKWLGTIYHMQARDKEASEMFSEAQQLFQQIGDELGVAGCLQELGVIYLEQDRYDEANGMITNAQKQFQNFGDQLQAAVCLKSLGMIYTMQGRYDSATEMILKAQKQFEEVGYREGVTQCLEILGSIYMNQAQYDEAVDMFSNAQMQYQNIGSIVQAASCYRYLGRTYRLQGQYEKAREAFTKALEFLKEFPGEKLRIGWTLLEFGQVFFALKDFAEARRKYEEARDIFDSHGQLGKQLDALLYFSVFSCTNSYFPLSYSSNSSKAMSAISASLPGVGASIDLDTDGLNLDNAAVEGSASASDTQVSSTASSSTQADNAGVTQTQTQSATAQATSSDTGSTNAPTSTATSSPSVTSASSSSVSQPGATSTVQENSSSASAVTANTLAANNGNDNDSSTSSSATSTSGSSSASQTVASASVAAASDGSSTVSPVSSTRTTGTQGTQGITSITRGGGAATITDDTPSTVTNFLTSSDPTPTSVGNIAANDTGDKSNSALPKSAIIGISVVGGVIALLVLGLILFKVVRNRNRRRQDAEWDSADNFTQARGVNFDVASLDNGGGVEALVSRSNSRSSQVSTGSLRQPPMAYVDNTASYGSTTTPGGYYYPGVAGGNTAADSYNTRPNPIAVSSPASIPNTYNYNYGIGPNNNNNYGVDMTAIGATTAAAGVAGIGVARTRSVRTTTTTNAGGNMDINTNNPNAPPNMPPMLRVPTSNNVASPFDSPEPEPASATSAVSVSQAYAGISSPMTASSINTVTGNQGFSAFGDSPSNLGMSQSNASSTSFEKLRGWKG